MLKCGIAMGDADGTDLHRYLRVLQFNSKREKNKRKKDETKPEKDNVVELRRGTIDEFW